MRGFVSALCHDLLSVVQLTPTGFLETMRATQELLFELGLFLQVISEKVKWDQRAISSINQILIRCHSQ